MSEVVNPLAASPVVAVTAVGTAEGSRGAAAALACAGADVDRAALLLDVGGRPPRPTLLASAAAQRLEERLVGHPPRTRVAARGQVCHLAVPADRDGFEAASAAVAVARGSLAVLHLAPEVLRMSVEGNAGPGLTGALLRADLATDRPLLALTVGELVERGLAVAVLKQRLSWLVERRALFGALAPDAAGGLPHQLAARLLSHPCYADPHDQEADPARIAKPERGDHAGPGSR